MAIVVGALTTVDFEGTCVISANWGYNPNVQRLYCLGEWTARSENIYYRPTETLNLTVYAPGPNYDTAASSEGCEDAGQLSATIDPGTCGEGETFATLGGNWWVTSYSYSKDDGTMPGQESWSMVRWKGLSSSLPAGFVAPTYIMRGIAEGQSSGGVDGSITGIVIEEPYVTAQTGSVSAGGFGRADTMYIGVVSSVGGGTSDAGTGTGSASIPYTPLYI
jgi:hypothetical protein